MELDNKTIFIIVFALIAGALILNLLKIEKFEQLNTSTQNNSQNNNSNSNCNIDESNKLNEKVLNYNKIYGGLYNHQISGCKNLNCDIDKDIIALNNIVLENNNSKDCVSCINNQKPINLAQKLNDVINNEKEALRNAQNASSNIEKFSTFNDLVYQNTSNVESPNDKIAEIRLSDNNTCGLLNYGKKVSDVYDNLLSNTNKDNNNYSMDSVFAFDNSETSQANF